MKTREFIYVKSIIIIIIIITLNFVIRFFSLVNFYLFIHLFYFHFSDTLLHIYFVYNFVKDLVTSSVAVLNKPPLPTVRKNIALLFTLKMNKFNNIFNYIHIMMYSIMINSSIIYYLLPLL